MKDRCRLALVGDQVTKAHDFHWYGRYSRKQIAEGFGDSYIRGRWDMGIVRLPKATVLLVTFEKTGKDPFNSESLRYHYGDRFLAPDLLLWQSQMSMGTEGKKALRVLDLSDSRVPVELFARRAEKEGGRTVPFTYCGPLSPLYTYGERPISAIWRLSQPLPVPLMLSLCVDSGPCRQVDIEGPESAPVPKSGRGRRKSSVAPVQ